MEEKEIKLKEEIKRISEKIHSFSDFSLLSLYESSLLIAYLKRASRSISTVFKYHGGDRKSKRYETFKQQIEQQIKVVAPHSFTTIKELKQMPRILLMKRLEQALRLTPRTLRIRVQLGNYILEKGMDDPLVLMFKEGEISQSEFLKAIRSLNQKTHLECKSCIHAHFSACPNCLEPILRCAKKDLFVIYRPSHDACEDYKE